MTPLPRHVPLVYATRGDHPELVHTGSLAVVDARGALIAGLGEPAAPSFTRSALKPLQALPFIEADGPARLGLTSHEVALMCASHSGEAIHVATAARLLARIDATEHDLQCGCHVPTFFAATATPAPAGARWTPLFHNCSGKHAGFLAWCRLHGQPLRDYLAPDSPLQQSIRATVERYAPGAALPAGIDGCSAPNYALPLDRLANAFGRLARGDSAALAALRFAMTRHPDLVSGTARSDLALMRTGGGDWVSKIGADGVQAIGVASRGIGIAIRIADGNPRALHFATCAVLQQLGLLDDPAATALAPFARTAVSNARGSVVGHYRAAFTLPRASSA